MSLRLLCAIGLPRDSVERLLKLNLKPDKQLDLSVFAESGDREDDEVVEGDRGADENDVLSCLSDCLGWSG